jgi:hypothetical protein
MEAFKAPGAGAKYRLGNEADTYGEIGLTHNWLRDDDPLNRPTCARRRCSPTAPAKTSATIR